MFDFNGKVVLLTGGLGGMALSITQKILYAGVRGVALLDLKNVEREKLYEELRKENCGKVIFIPTDVTKNVQVEAAFQTTINVFKNLDIVINTAGIIDEINWQSCIDVNLTGSITTTKLAMNNYLLKHRSGDEGIIVNISSVGGLEVFPCNIVYGATKFGLVGLGRTLGLKHYYDQTNVRVITICPGLTITPLLNNIEKKVNSSDVEIMQSLLSGDLKPQEPDFVGESIINVINKGESGSVWVCEANDLYEIEFPTPSMMRKK